MDDIEIMARVRSGEIGLLEELFERHHRQLYRYFLIRTADPAASEDGVQETFHRVLRYRKNFRGLGSFAVWLFSIARNVYLDLRNDSNASIPIHYAKELTAESEDHDLHEATRMLYWAIEQLEASDREIVILSRLKELSMTDVAEIIGCSAGAARVRVHRAVRRLREVYLERSGRGANELSNG